MAKIKKTVQKQNLISFQTWLVDSEANSRYFRLSEVPDILTAGKNAILINGSPELEPTTEVKIEILDSQGNPVFVAPVRNYAEGLARVLSIEVYDDTPVGPATITLLGHLRRDEFGNLPPEQFEKSYNVKWSKQVVIAPTKSNTTTIRLYETPTLVVTEVLSPFRSTIDNPVTSSVSVLLVATATGSVDYFTPITGSGVTFSQDIVGADFMCATPTPFTASIVSVPNNTTVVLGSKIPSASVGSQYFVASKIQYLGTPTFSLSPETRSFANVYLDNLTTFSGEINRVKVYGRSLDQKGDYQIIGDFRASSPELTTTQSLSTGEPIIPMGDITSQAVVSAYWNAGTINGNTYTVDGNLHFNYASSVISDAMHLNEGPLTAVGSTTPRYFMGSKNSFVFKQDHEYEVDMHIGCANLGPFDSRMDVFLFGTAFPSSSSSPYGVQVGSYILPAVETFRDFGSVSTSIIAPTDGSAVLRFVLYAGDWNVGDVVISHADERGFNANEVNALLPMLNRRLETMQFKAELYDANSNLVPILIESPPVFFDGGNATFRGTDNRIIGDLKVGTSGQGIVMTAGGYTGSGGPVVDAPAIYIGQGTYGNINTPFLVASSSTGTIFSLGNALKWDGQSLFVSGSISLNTGALETRTTAVEVSASQAAASASQAAISSSRSFISQSTLDSRIFTDSSGFITRPPTGSQAGLYLGTNFLGFYSASLWRTYMDNVGHFFLTGSNGSSNYLAWDGTSLTIAGNITITAGSTLAQINTATTASNTATTNAATAITTANNATASANTALNSATTASASAATAQNTATSASVTASSAISTANTALGTANTAQSTANIATASAATANTSASQASASAAIAYNSASQAQLTASIAKASASAAQSAADFLDTKIFTDANGQLVKTPNTVAPGLYLGATNLGFYSGSSWKTYMDNLGKFFLTGSSTNFLAWDGSTLTIAGNINIVAGPSLTAITNAQSTANIATGSAAQAQATASSASSSVIQAQATASSAFTSASTAQTTANQATASAAQAQSTASNAVTSASVAQGTANTAVTNAATAQTTANTATASAAAAQATASAASSSAAVANTSSSLIDAKVFTDSSGKLVKVPNTGSAGLYIGSTFLGYYSASAWRTYMSDTGKFFLTGSVGSSNYLNWDGNTLNIAGNIEILSGNTLGAIQNAQSTANVATASAATASFSASAAQTAANAAQGTANVATGSAAQAQATASAASSSAIAAQGTANTAVTNAATAQTTANNATASAAIANTSASQASASAAAAFNSASNAAALALAATQSAQFLDTKIFTDAAGKLVKTPSTSSAGLYMGAANLGYYSGSMWKTYMDNTGKFYLTGSGGSSNFLAWDGTSLTIAGNINIISGPSLTAIQAAQSTANTATASAAQAQSTASAASSSVIQTQATASAASSSAVAAQGTANTAVTNAATAQGTANQATASAAQAQATASAASSSALTAQASASLAQASASAAATLALAATQSAQFLDTKIFTDAQGKLAKPPVTNSAGLFLGNSFLGYYDGSNWRTYMDNAGKFFLTGSSATTNFLTWDGTNLTIAGNITLLSGPSLTAINAAQFTASNAVTSASVANTSASLASGSAASARGIANIATGSAAQAQATASQASASIVTTNATVATVDSKIFTDSTGKLTKTPNTSSAGLFLGQTFMGYYNGSAWKTYMSDTGNFFLTGAGSNGLTWNSATSTLSITGSLQITSATPVWGVGISAGDNLLTTVKDWVVQAVGATAPNNFGYNGPASYNSIVLGTTPYSTTGKLWLAAPSADNNADGGWNTADTPIDPTKTYRYCTWVKRSGVDSGNVYHGCDMTGNITDIGGAVNTNPYFTVPVPSQLNLGEWYLMVGYVFPYNYSGGQQNISGVYAKATGAKVLSGLDYRWTNSSVTRGFWRDYLYYVQVAGAQASFYSPQLHVVDGSEPSLDSILAVGATGVANAATANTAASNAQGTANTAVSNAATAQSTADGAQSFANGVDAKVFTDTAGKIVKAPINNGAGLYIGSTNMGYYNASGQWTTYMANNGNFFLSGTGTDSLSWSSGVLTINGAINITGGPAATAISNAQATASAASASVISTSSSLAAGIASTNTTVANNLATVNTSISGVDNKVFTDTFGKIVKAPTNNGNGLYIGNTFMGYYESGNFKTYMANNGNFAFTGDGNNFISWDGSLFTVKANQFKLTTSTIKVDSTVNSGMISLGAATSPSSGQGFYADGTGNWRVGNPSTSQYVQWDVGTGKLQVCGAEFISNALFTAPATFNNWSLTVNAGINMSLGSHFQMNNGGRLRWLNTISGNYEDRILSINNGGHIIMQLGDINGETADFNMHYYARGGHHFNGTMYTNDIIASRGDATGVIYFGSQAGGGRYLYYDGTNYQFPNANVFAPGYFTNSSRTLKKDITLFTDKALELLDKVKVVNFKYIADDSQTPKVGFIAEDTDSILSTPNHNALDTANAIGLLIKAVQELSALIKKI